ncbi:hypothetical protein HETIRDRAFT_308164, partial [Heterobasidion irregulare TC 32-1]
DSTPGVLRAWDSFGKIYGFEGAAAAHDSHGRRLADTLGQWCNINDSDKLEQAEVIRFEDEVIQGGPVVLPGALNLLEQINAGSTSSAAGWTIVTSATNIYTPRALAACKVPVPSVGYVTSNDIQNGKPHPDPYLAGAKKCGIDPTKCLVVEDAPSGLKSGHAAGAKTLAVCTSHTRELIRASGSNPDFVVSDLTHVSVTWKDGRLVVEIDESP